MSEQVQALVRKLTAHGEDYELLALDEQRAHLRFVGPFEGQEVVWDARIEALGSAGAQRFIDVGDRIETGIPLGIGLPLDRLSTAVLAMTVRMVRQYKLMRRGRYAFDASGPVRPQKMISGGQTGVDRAALDAAIELGIAIGGYCPKGRRAEDGPINPGYPLIETPSADYPERTALNVRESDGTLILARGVPSGGTALTRNMAGQHAKPCLVIDLDTQGDPRAVGIWLARHGIRTLNVAGPRESTNPGVYRQAIEFLRRAFGTQK